MTVCEGCGGEISEADAHCRHCGASLSNSTIVLTEDSSEDEGHQEHESTTVSDRDPPPGFFEAFVPYFLPGGSNKSEMKRRLGGCPGCGEGQELEIEPTNTTRSFIADPTACDIKCTRCGMVLEGEGWAFDAVEGDPALVGEELTQSDCSNLADARREGDTERVQKLLADITGEEVDTKTWDPRYPILSVFTAVMLIWGGFFSLGQSGSPIFDFALFTSLAVLIIPRVRRAVVKTVRVKTQWDVTGRISMIVIGGVYSLLVAAVALLMIGEAANDPEASAGAGVMMIVIAFVIALGIVYSIRVYRRFSGS